MRISKGSDMTLLVAFIMWILVNILDIVISIVAIRLGAGEAGEVGFLAGIGSFTGVVIVKMILVLIVGGSAVSSEKEKYTGSPQPRPVYYLHLQ